MRRRSATLVVIAKLLDETRALAKELLADKKGLPSPIQKELDAIGELNEEIERLRGVISAAAELLRECKEHVEGDLYARIEEWECGC